MATTQKRAIESLLVRKPKDCRSTEARGIAVLDCLRAHNLSHRLTTFLSLYIFYCHYKHLWQIYLRGYDIPEWTILRICRPLLYFAQGKADFYENMPYWEEAKGRGGKWMTLTGGDRRR